MPLMKRGMGSLEVFAPDGMEMARSSGGLRGLVAALPVMVGFVPGSSPSIFYHSGDSK